MCRGAFVLYKKRNEFRWFGFTSVTANHVNIGGAFIEGVTSSQDHFLSTAHLHYDGSLQHVDKHMSVMTMYSFRTAWRVHNGDQRTFFPREPGEIPRQQGS